PDRRLEDPDAAEVEHPEAGMMRDEVVPRMRIGVERPELEHLPPKEREELLGDPVLQLLVDAGGEDVLDRIALEELHREHAARAELRMDARDHDLAIVREELPEELQVL